MIKSKKLSNIHKTQSAISRNRNTTLDVLRIILAILVVYIHLNNKLYNKSGLDGLSLVFDDIIMILARTAVPIFLAISGYCLYRNNQSEERASIKRSLRHLILLTMGCFAIYITINIFLVGPQMTAARFTTSRFFQLVLFNQTGGIIGSAALWFLLALIACYIIYYLYPYFSKSQKYLPIMAVLLYTWTICVSPVYGNLILDKEPIFLYRNYLSLGLPFFTLGYFCHKYQQQIKATISNQTIKFTILAFALYFMEQIIYLANGHHRNPMEISIMMPLVVVGILMLATQHPKLLAKTKFPAWSAKYSLYLYIGHTAVISIMSKCLFNNNPPLNLRYYKLLILYLAVVAITITLSFTYVWSKRVLQTAVVNKESKRG